MGFEKDVIGIVVLKEWDERTTVVGGMSFQDASHIPSGPWHGFGPERTGKYVHGLIIRATLPSENLIGYEGRQNVSRLTYVKIILLSK